MEIDQIIKASLEEDIGTGDATTLATIPKDKMASAEFLSKDEGILCGIDVAEKVFQSLGEIEFTKNIEDGQPISKGDIIATVKGPAQILLTGERTALNFMQRLSGIATIANNFQSLSKAKILDTRKTSPLLRPLEKYAVKIGGGTNHRFGLYDMILIKDNHIKVAGSITKAVNQAKSKYPDLKIEVETENIEMVKEALSVKADRIMLDNMGIETMKEAVQLINNQAETEASGNINLENIKSVSETGVDYISIGSSLTNNAKSLDISLNIII